MKMNMIKKVWIKLKPANGNLEWMDVKEMSERVEMAEVQAREAVGLLMHEKKIFERACHRYAVQCGKPKF